MKRSKTSPLSVEVLEDRCCPSVTVHVSAGNLHVTDDQTADLVIRQVSKDAFAVSNNGNLIGTYQVSGSVTCDLIDNGGSVAVDLGGVTSPGDVTINLGSGNGSAHVFDGTVGGKLLIAGGTGTDQVELGQASAPGTSLTVLGDMRASLGGGDDSMTIDGNVTIQGDLTANSANSLRLLAGSAVEGSVTISGAADTNDVDLQGTIGHVLRFDGNGFQSNTLTVDSTAVIGQFWAQLSTANNELTMNGTVRDKLFIEGQGNDTINLGGTILGPARLHLIGSSETVDVSGSIGADATASGLTIQGGSGAMNVTLEQGSVIHGPAEVHLKGSGDTVALAGTIKGNLDLDTGAGNDAVTFADLTLQGTGTVNLGAGDDTFTMGDKVEFQPESLTVNGGPGDNTYVGSTQGVVTHGFKNYES